jgi:hypothetical protein
MTTIRSFTLKGYGIMASKHVRGSARVAENARQQGGRLAENARQQGVSSADSGEFAERRWYKFLAEHREKSKDPTPLEMAQRILQLPNNRSFETVIQLIE